MSEITYERIKENLSALNMKNTIDIIDNSIDIQLTTCNTLIENLNKAHFENILSERLKTHAKYKVLIIDEIGYLPMDIQGANLLFQLIAKRYEKKAFLHDETYQEFVETLKIHYIFEPQQDGKYPYPLEDFYISSSYGRRQNPTGKGTKFHHGLDMVGSEPYAPII